MQELNTLDNSQLLDLLAKLTADYTKMITDNDMGDDYEKCKLAIKALQTEIDTRKKKGIKTTGETNITTPPDFS